MCTGSRKYAGHGLDSSYSFQKEENIFYFKNYEEATVIQYPTYRYFFTMRLNVLQRCAGAIGEVGQE